MKRRSLLLIAVLVLSSCALATAQAVTVSVGWNPPDPGTVVKNYNFSVDSAQPVPVPVVTDASCACIKAPAFVAAPGSHTVKVSSVYQVLPDDPGSILEGEPATLVFTVNNGGQIKNLKVSVSK